MIMVCSMYPFGITGKLFQTWIFHTLEKNTSISHPADKAMETQNDVWPRSYRYLLEVSVHIFYNSHYIWRKRHRIDESINFASCIISCIYQWHIGEVLIHGPLARYAKLWVRMRQECRERFPRHRRWAIPPCITARASRTCRDACRNR